MKTLRQNTQAKRRSELRTEQAKQAGSAETLHNPATWARWHRQALIERLGGTCEICGTTTDLELDHINGRDWQPRKLSSHCRIARYEREAAAGHLRVLCADCNKKFGFPHNRPF